jgi:hypothetical protein
MRKAQSRSNYANKEDKKEGTKEGPQYKRHNMFNPSSCQDHTVAMKMFNSV